MCNCGTENCHEFDAMSVEALTKVLNSFVLHLQKLCSFGTTCGKFFSIANTFPKCVE
jgi:hypothetical protein